MFNSSKLGIVSPDQFGFTVSFTALAMVVLGGMGNIWGVAAGAFITLAASLVSVTVACTLFGEEAIPLLRRSHL